MELLSGKINTSENIVAVIDIGVDYTHSDLVNQMRDGSNCVDENNTLVA
jgi:hypothetical protein